MLIEAGIPTDGLERVIEESAHVVDLVASAGAALDVLLAFAHFLGKLVLQCCNLGENIISLKS